MNAFRVAYAEVPSFYVAVERLDDPGLRARPVVVGGSPGKRGKVQAASSEARAKGVEVGTAIDAVRGMCPDAALVRTNMKRYRELSSQLHIALREVSQGIEVDGLAGAYLELPAAARASQPAARSFAQALVEHVRDSLGLPLRVGIAPVKFLARLAAHESGPDGILCVAESEVERFLAPLSPDRLPGVGAKAQKVLEEMKISTVGALRDVDPREAEARLGRRARQILAFARGEDASPVRLAAHPKTLSLEYTFEDSVVDRSSIEARLAILCQNAEASLRQQKLHASRVSIKVRYDDTPRILTRTRTLVRPVQRGGEVYAAALRLLDRTEAGLRPVRLLGVGLAGLDRQVERDDQLELFER